jgi:phytoene dehydrogenase-like protein
LRYDAAIIGAGAEGLAAATLLGQAGLRTLVIERSERIGGRSTTREFHPGFRASPFADELAPIPADLYWAFDLARRGAVFAPPRFSLALWPGRHHLLALRETAGSSAARLLAQMATLRAAVLAQAMREAASVERRTIFGRTVARAEAWLAENWITQSLGGAIGAAIGEPDAGAHVAALALDGRSADPSLPGSALHLLLAGATGGRLAGGLGGLADALLAAARDAGVEFVLGLEATDIYRRRGRVVGVGLADGSRIATHNVISTLDLKRTFLTFFSWNALPKPVVRRVRTFRMAGGAARVLFALDRPLQIPVPACAELHVAPCLDRMTEAYQSWRAGVVAEHLPVTLRFVSDGDPGLAPPGAAVVTATLGAVPFRLFDGGWTHEKRALLRERAIAAAESVLPGFAARVVAAEIVAPPDIEDALGATDGDLLGGEIAADQMPIDGLWPDHTAPRTPIAGLYLAGSHLSVGAIATCAAGASAARALIADRARGLFQ